MCVWLCVGAICTLASFWTLYSSSCSHIVKLFNQFYTYKPFRSWMTRCLTASILLSLSQSKVRDSSVTFHPKLAREWRTMWLLLAAFHMSSTQHVNLQWRYCASVLGIISLSNCILSQISLVPRPCPAFCFLEYGKGGRGPGIFSHMSDIGIERMIERMVERVVERVYM